MTQLNAPPASVLISTQVRHCLRTVMIRQDAFIWVRSGTKTLLGTQGERQFRVNDAVLLVHGTQWDVINDPAPQGRYEALVLLFGNSAIRDFATTYGAEFPLQCATVGHAPISVDDELAQALRRCSDTLSSSASLRVQQHRVMEVLLLLAERGNVLRPRESLSWPDQIRNLIGQRPYAPWDVEQLAQAFHISASTLRRRLEPFGTNASELVREVRLETALGLLQSTSLSVGEVAQRCGYESHSRFSAAFRARYGFAPSYLRQPASAQTLHDPAQKVTPPG